MAPPGLYWEVLGGAAYGMMQEVLSCGWCTNHVWGGAAGAHCSVQCDGAWALVEQTPFTNS
jgi:hypothetical protein